ncbi:MAG TPA: hypothetical protein VF927_06510 [Solirubrobacteraceae bacterium]
MSEPLVSEDAPQIEWDSAEVSDAELHVSLGGEIPKRWAKRFAEVFDRLGHDSEDRWGAMKVSKREIAVRGLREGCEADLRHQLESALLQTNADLGAGRDEGAQVDDASPEQQRDGRMTAVFRGFAEDS